MTRTLAAIAAVCCAIVMQGCGLAYEMKANKVTNSYMAMTPEQLKQMSTDDILWVWKWSRTKRMDWDDELFAEVVDRCELTDRQIDLIRNRMIHVGMPRDILELSWGFGSRPKNESRTWLGHSYRIEYPSNNIYFNDGEVSGIYEPTRYYY